MTEQARYQVRLDWGVAGLAAVAEDAEVVVWVDAAAQDGTEAGAAPLEACPAGAAVVETGLRTAAATAAWVVELQRRIGRRLTIAIVAAGTMRPDGSLRLEAPDHLAAGAVVDGLIAAGIDATSPEAAIAENAYRGLRRAVGHLVSASAPSIPAEARRVDAGLDPDAVRVLRPHPEDAVSPRA
jgi:2-phosphosulfolactate phosphatase